MPIMVTCECGKQLKASDEMRGKKVRCPACKAVVTVADAGTEPPAVPAGPRAEAPQHDSKDFPQPRRRPAEEEEEPRAKRRPRRDEQESETLRPAKKKAGTSKILQFVGLGVVLLGCMGTLGSGAWFYLFSGGIDERLVGQWNLDPVMTKMVSAKLNKPFPDDMKNMRLVFRIDGTCSVLVGGNQWTGKWSKLRAWEKGVRIQITHDKDRIKEVWEFSFVDNQQIVVEDGLPPGVFRRSGDPPTAEDRPGDTVPSGPEGRSQPVFTMTSAALGKEFADDKVAADAKYKDKWLSIEGPLNDITVEPMGDGIILTIEGYKAKPDELGNRIRCFLLANQVSKAMRITRGQTLKVKGKCAEGGGGPFIILQECEILSNGHDPAIRLNLTRLAKEHATDPKTAVSKYVGKQVSFTGVLVELKKGNAANVAIVSATTGRRSKDLRISAAYGDEWKERFAKYKPGDRITIKGEFSSIGDGLVNINRCWPVR